MKKKLDCLELLGKINVRVPASAYFTNSVILVASIGLEILI